jgi:hypothetical protein
MFLFDVVFEWKHFAKNEQQDLEVNEQQIEQQQPAEKQKRYLVLPYSNHKVDTYAEKLTKLVNETFPQVDFKIAFKAPNEIGKMFPFKDNIKENLIYHLLYFYVFEFNICFIL